MGKSHWNTGDMCRCWELNHHLTLRNSFIAVLRYYGVTDKSTSSGKSYKIYVSRIYAPTMATTKYSSLLYTVIWCVGTQLQEEVAILFCAVTSQPTQQRPHDRLIVHATSKTIGGLCHVFDYLTGKKVKQSLCTSLRHAREWKYGSTDS
jgi:hypothetical protein